MLLDGATPSRLIQRVLEEYPTQGIAQITLIDGYFSAAFGNKIYRVGTVDCAVLSNLQYAYLNGDVLQKMLEELSGWRSSVGGGEECWCDDIEAVDVRARMQEFDGKADPYLGGSWDKLDATAQAHIRQNMASLAVAQEQVHTLRLLAERLQQKLFHIEQQAKNAVTE